MQVMDMNYEKRYKANCFSNSNSVMELFLMVVGKCIKTCDSETAKANVELDSFRMTVLTIEVHRDV